MLQDLWIPANNVVPGDHVVIEGEFCKVIESGIDVTMWRLFFFSPRLKKNVEQHFEDAGYGSFSFVRVRPCGPSEKCEET